MINNTNVSNVWKKSLNVGTSVLLKKPYGNNMIFIKYKPKHYAVNRFFKKVLWIFFLLF